MLQIVTLSHGRLLSPQAAEASRSTLHPVDRVLAEYLGEKPLARLKGIQRELAANVPLAPILQAPSKKALDRISLDALTRAAEYYIEAGIVIWRGLGHDYRKLRDLSALSSHALEGELMEGRTLLWEETYVKTLAGLRVVTKIGEWLSFSEEQTAPEDQAPLLDYLGWFLVGTFVLSCILESVRRQAEVEARPINLQALARALGTVARACYRTAMGQKLYVAAAERSPQFWSPRWQEEEAALDFHKRSQRVSDMVPPMVRHHHRLYERLKEL